jgi:hypothetical protein
MCPSLPVCLSSLVHSLTAVKIENVADLYFLLNMKLLGVGIQTFTSTIWHGQRIRV